MFNIANTKITTFGTILNILTTYILNIHLNITTDRLLFHEHFYRALVQLRFSYVIHLRVIHAQPIVTSSSKEILFHLTAAASHFPSARLTHKTSMCNGSLLNMTRGCDGRETLKVHSVTGSRPQYKYGEVLCLKSDSKICGSSFIRQHE
jgi:hypothetical protein